MLGFTEGLFEGVLSSLVRLKLRKNAFGVMLKLCLAEDVSRFSGHDIEIFIWSKLSWPFRVLLYTARIVFLLMPEG